MGATRRLHETIRARVGDLLSRARITGRPELAAEPGEWEAGDLSYALDKEADAALETYGQEIGARHPLTLIAEGPGVRQYGESARGAPLRILVDPVDGTRSLMHDMRSAWALTGIAPDHGELTRLSDIVLAVQTELPTTSAGFYKVMTAQKDEGAFVARHTVADGKELERQPLLASPDDRIDNGYLCFSRYLPVERPIIASIEERFLTRVLDAYELSPRLIYDDQYLCSAGQLALVTAGSYRMLADLRGWLSRSRGIDNFTAKPYDLAAALIYREAGVPLLGEDFEPLDAPLDTETKLTVIAFANEPLRRALQPHLQSVMETAG
jgi:fructose-1,6-bisphosphatase/inositol monophosphatase family enzyme